MACRAPGSRAEGLGFKSEAGVGKLAGLKAEVAGIFGDSLQCVGGGFSFAVGCNWVTEKRCRFKELKKAGLRARRGLVRNGAGWVTWKCWRVPRVYHYHT